MSRVPGIAHFVRYPGPFTILVCEAVLHMPAAAWPGVQDDMWWLADLNRTVMWQARGDIFGLRDTARPIPAEQHGRGPRV